MKRREKIEIYIFMSDIQGRTSIDANNDVTRVIPLFHHKTKLVSLVGRGRRQAIK